MPTPPAPGSAAEPLLRARNYIFLGLAVASLIVGYVLLKGGGTTVAAALLVLGYCVLFPLGIAL